MSTASVDSRKPWLVGSDEKPAALAILLLKRTYVLPWSQFLYAEGADDEIRLVFATHDVVVKGTGLTALLTDLAFVGVASIQEPTTPDRFFGGPARFIREIVVQAADGRRD